MLKHIYKLLRNVLGFTVCTRGDRLFILKGDDSKWYEIIVHPITPPI